MLDLKVQAIHWKQILRRQYQFLVVEVVVDELEAAALANHNNAKESVRSVG